MSVLFCSQAAAKPPTKASVQALVSSITEKYAPLEKAKESAWYQASISGKDEDFAKAEAAQNTLDGLLSDPAVFADLKVAKTNPPKGLDARTARQIDILYRMFLARQVAPELLAEINKLQSEVEQIFNGYRAKIAGKEYSQNELKKVLRESVDSAELQAVWEGQKAVGDKVIVPLIKLVHLRNQVAQQLGYSDYHDLALAVSDQTPQEVFGLFEALDKLTEAPFLSLKAEADLALQTRLNLSKESLRPWHYQDFFFQEPPAVFNVDYETIYKNEDPVELSRKFYAGIGLPIDDVLAASDLYEKPGKSPHAFCADLDRDQDVRVLANVVPGYDWTMTMVHELGHAVYDKFKDRTAPFLLRGPAHMLTTEGFAMMLDRLVQNPYWIGAMLGISDEERDKMVPGAHKTMAFSSLVFARWCLVMLHFEKALYANPNQDLNTLWWTLVEKYQGLTRPDNRNAPDFASKVHFVVAPVYYHNYMMGQIFGAQVHEVITRKVARRMEPFETVYVGNPDVGRFMRKKIFEPGATMSWRDLTQKITGKPLSPQAYAAQFARYEGQ